MTFWCLVQPCCHHIACLLIFNNRGEVLLKSALDRETDATFRFQVIAYDGYYYSVPAATIDVIVLDVNDNEPKFVDTYKFTVSGEYACQVSALFLLN